jgi:hypothetical protein
MTLNGCSKGGGSPLAGDATKTLLNFRDISDELVEYARQTDNRFHRKLDEVDVPVELAAGKVTYIGNHARYQQPERAIILYADREKFSVAGIPVIWSDGAVESISASKLAAALRDQDN